MHITNKNILVLAPHTDDGEWGAGGTMAKLKEQNNKIYYAAFSTCKESLPTGMPHDTLAKECKNATQILGVEELFIYDFKVRYFNYHRQEILEEMVKLSKLINFDFVFTPCSNDIHQDHHTIYNESIRAFKKSNILGYELVWNNIHMHTNYFSVLEKRHIDLKTDAILCYQSQEFRNYHNHEYISGLAKVRGTQTGYLYAEAFEVIKIIQQ
jgi:LmbE family N-acetylglucosaminyl deacetylase